MADDDRCGWEWPTYIIAMTAISGVLLIAGIVLTIINTRMYRLMKLPKAPAKISKGR
jgi:hypothetical protein